MIFTGKNQTLILATGRDLTGIASQRILYQKPSGTTGVYSSQVYGNSLRYKFSDSDIDENGTWRFQAEVTTGSDKLAGLIVKAEARNPIISPE
jgi:hypothetical protein